AKLTLEAEGEAGPLISVTLYDGPESHRILFACNALSHSAISEAQTRELDAVEPDGEAAGIEFSGTWVRLVQLYTESTPGNKVHQRFLLAEISRDQPTWVIDHYDDPRLDHT
ncbi:MAG TPA: hypothetical protein VHK69_14190, partial [Chitinophagaceae bacterium]|nr:hypothetical protein [Chitinophagaceae bacterium]